MNIEVNENKNVKIVSVKGRLDTTNYNEFEVVIEKLFNEGASNVILDLQALVYISSSGLRVILMTLKKTAAKQGKLVLCNMQDGIREIFEISGFTTIFTIESDIDSALKLF